MTPSLAALPAHIIRPAQLDQMARSLIVAGAVGCPGNIVLPLDARMASELGQYLERSLIVVTRWEEVRALDRAATERQAESARMAAEAAATLERAGREFRKSLWLGAVSLAWCAISVAAWWTA